MSGEKKQHKKNMGLQIFFRNMCAGKMQLSAMRDKGGQRQWHLLGWRTAFITALSRHLRRTSFRIQGWREQYTGSGFNFLPKRYQPRCVRIGQGLPKR